LPEKEEEAAVGAASSMTSAEAMTEATPARRASAVQRRGIFSL
jgi:hypothetical protein